MQIFITSLFKILERFKLKDQLISELEEINTFWQLLINIIATMPKHITWIIKIIQQFQMR